MIKREKTRKNPKKNGGSLRSPPAGGGGGGGGVCGSRGGSTPTPLLPMPDTEY